MGLSMNLLLHVHYYHRDEHVESKIPLRFAYALLFPALIDKITA